MAYPVTRLAIRKRALNLADLPESSFRDLDSVNDIIQVAFTSFYDELVEAGPADYYSKSSPVVVVAGTLAYDLPSDFRSLTGVYEIFGNRKREVDPMVPGRFSDYDVPGNAVIELEYVPAPPVFQTDEDPVTGSFDGVSGWDEYVAALVARDLLMMEESPIDAIQLKVNELQARIRRGAKKRSRGVQYMTDVYGGDAWDMPTRATCAYRLRAQTIEFYSSATGRWV